jgi:hypothetical protein
LRETLGATFVRQASAPCDNALGLLRRQQIEEALGLLDADGLLRALNEAVVKTARRSGASQQRVHDLLPWRELRLIASLVSACRGEALAARAKQTKASSGDSGDAPPVRAGAPAGSIDAGAGLRHIMQTSTDIVALADVMELLGASLTRWSELIAESGALIDQTAGLRAAYVWKWTRRALIAAAAIAGLAWLGWRAAEMRALDSRIEAALTRSDPCTVQIDEADVDRASEDQRRRATERQAECAAIRQRAATDARRRASCDALINSVERGGLTAEDNAFSGAKAPLLQRIAKGALDPGDLMLTSDALNDGCPQNRERLWHAAVKASSRSSAAWAAAEGISDPLRNALLSADTPLSPDSRRALAQHAEAVAKAAAGTDSAEKLERAMKLCELGRRFGVDPGGWCTGVAILARRAQRERR